MAVTNSTELTLLYSKLMICLAIAVHDVHMQLSYNTMCIDSLPYRRRVNYLCYVHDVMLNS